MKKVKQENLKGDIKDFPIEVVQKMCEEQVIQGSRFDVSVFQDYSGADVTRGGFDWDETKDDHDFWDDVISNRNFNRFFDRYPKHQEYTDVSNFLKSTKEHQVGGDHYKNFAIQPIEFIMANNVSFCVGSVIKYVMRYKEKNGVEDLKKARQYINFLIEEEQKVEDSEDGV